MVPNGIRMVSYKYSWPLNNAGLGGPTSRSQKFVYNYSWPSTKMDSQPWSWTAQVNWKNVPWKAKSPLAKDHWFIGDCMVSFKIISPFEKKRLNISDYFLVKILRIFCRESQVHLNDIWEKKIKYIMKLKSTLSNMSSQTRNPLSGNTGWGKTLFL